MTQRRTAAPGRIRGEHASQINIILNLIYGLLGLAIVIALIGIANTLALSVHERRRELGLLRAVGMTRPQVRSAIQWESVMIALMGTNPHITQAREPISGGPAQSALLAGRRVHTSRAPIDSYFVVVGVVLPHRTTAAVACVANTALAGAAPKPLNGATGGCASL